MSDFFSHTLRSLGLAACLLASACSDGGGDTMDTKVDGGGTPSVCVDPVTDCASPSVCHVFECQNSACVEVNTPPATACGDTVTSVCNAADTCDGMGTCQPNFGDVGLSCGDASTSVCDSADSCDGMGACLPNHMAVDTACGDTGASECNAPDSCDANGQCSPNFLVGTLCGQAATSICNLQDICSATGECVINFAPPGTVCGNPANTNCDRADSCDGAGTCSANISIVGTTCGDSDNTTCDSADSCNGAGVCLQNFASGGASCGNTTNEDCNAPDSCNGTGTCLANLSAAGTNCGDTTNDDCDTPDTCNAIGDCNDNFIAIGTACGDSTNDQCDLLDTCNGMGTCNDNFIPAGTACGDGTSGDCDLADSCNGAGDCADNFIAINTSCGDAVPSPCDAADTCNSTGTCLDNVFSNGTNCDDGNACTSVSSCLTGVCEATTILACEALWCFDNGGFTTVPNVGSGSASYGAGLGGLGSNTGNNVSPAGCPGGTGNAISATSWTQGSFASALSTSDCYVFEAATGLDPLVLSFDNQRGANGPTQWGVAVQTEPGAVLQTVTINQATGPAFAGSPMRVVSLESLELDVQNAAVIHICGYGAISAGSDWRVDNVRVFTGGCSDGVENGNETDPDCGGPDCAPCT